MQKTLTAGQIGDSNGAYSGREVRLTTQGIEVHGVLRYSNNSTEGPWVHLVVGETFHLVNDDVTVEFV
jgi:hypothetical protein